MTSAKPAMIRLNDSGIRAMRPIGFLVGSIIAADGGASHLI